MNDVRRLLKNKEYIEKLMQQSLDPLMRVVTQQRLDVVCKEIEEAREEWNKLFETQELDQLKQRVVELEASNKELLDVLEDFVIDVEGYFGFSETDDMEPEDDVAYFIGAYCRAKHLIKKEKGTDQ